MRASLLVVLLASLAAGLGNAADGLTPKGRVVSREFGPNRAAEFNVQGSCFAYREVVPGGKANYFAQFNSTVLSAEDLAELLKLTEKLKGKQKTDAKEVNRASVV